MNIKKVVIGTWPISGDFGKVNLTTIQQTIEKCYDVGFKQFDTAPSYGQGFAELILGNVLMGKHDCLINTKIGNIPFFGKSFLINDLKMSIENSLARLKGDCINILFLHNPRNEIENYDEIFELMEKLKKEGKIRHSGLSKARGVDYGAVTDLNQFDYIQDDVNLLYLKPILSKSSFDYKFMARSPLASGLLSGKVNNKTQFLDGDHRSTWLKGERLSSLLKRIKIIDKLSNIPISSLSRRLLLNHSMIDNVIFGVKRPEHVDDIINDCNLKIENEEKFFQKIVELHHCDFGLINEKHLGY